MLLEKDCKRGKKYMATGKEKELVDIIEGEERRKYAAKHGIYSLMYTFLTKRNDEESEKIYKICNEKGITWEEYLGIDPEKMKNIII